MVQGFMWRYTVKFNLSYWFCNPSKWKLILKGFNGFCNEEETSVINFREMCQFWDLLPLSMNKLGCTPLCWYYLRKRFFINCEDSYWYQYMRVWIAETVVQNCFQENKVYCAFLRMPFYQMHLYIFSLIFYKVVKKNPDYFAF